MPFPNKLYHSKELRQLEQRAIETHHIDADTLMERAGTAAFAALMQQWPSCQHIAVICGGGNNAGDGYVVARLAHLNGLKVEVWWLTEISHLKGPALNAARACVSAGVQQHAYNIATDSDFSSVDVIVDAILGIGLHGSLKPAWQQAISTINQSQKPVLALDIPSGLDADSGHIVDTAITADVTVTFIAVKPGLLTGAGPTVVGKLVYANLEIPEAVFNDVAATANLLSSSSWIQQPRNRNAHKGDFGHVLVIGGDYGMAGAVRMAAEAAARVGAGLVSIATRPEHIMPIIAARPELMCHGINGAEDLDKLLKKATVVVVGPGLGMQRWWGDDILTTLINSALPLIVDADALNLLALRPKQRENWILTPHPGEAARLLQCKTDEIQQDRISAVKTLQQQFGGIAVLKGAGTLIRGADTTWLCDAGNPGMATGGMGDVLAGVIGGLLAQSLTLEVAATTGVYIHAKAADLAAAQGERGMLALDLMPHLRRLVNGK
ncbi:NAD(P)H-hydrate dehydratase [soil metagenome]